MYARAVPFSNLEMEFIHAILSIDPEAKFSIKSKLENRQDFLYGGIEWKDGYEPISYEQVLEKIIEERQNGYNKQT